MPPSTFYEWNTAINSQYGGSGTLTAGTGDYIWQYAQNLVSKLKAMTVAPWVTRGSSRVNAATPSFSATPDGVDHWVPLTGTVAQFCGTGAAQPVWHVLENIVSGWQVCIQVMPTTAPQTSGYLAITLAKNKFESGGAWRNAGSVTAVVRPADTTSSPSVDREQTTGTTTGSTLPPFDSASTVGYRNPVGNRPDGKGFWSYSFGINTTFSSGNLQFFTCIGTAPTILHPYQDDLISNNQSVFRFIGDALSNRLNDASPDASPTSTWRMIIRENDGSSKNCAGLEICLTNGTVVFSATTGGVADSALGVPPIGPLAFFSDNTFIMRGSLPDMWVVAAGSFTQSLETWNSREYIKVGGFLLPWDGTTNLAVGTPRTGFFWAPTGTEPSPPVIQILDPKRFNLGLEKI